MKKILFLFAVIALSTQISFAQETCEQLPDVCAKMMENSDGSIFVSDGQTYQTMLDGEPAEFETTFYGGTTYRVASSAGSGDNYVIFTVYNQNGDVLFTNEKYENTPYWDFQVTSTIPVRIEAKLDENKKISGCLVLMIGFKK